MKLRFVDCTNFEKRVDDINLLLSKNSDRNIFCM